MSDEGNIHMFSQHEDMKQFLLETGEAVIVEASPRDRIWGIGMGASNENATYPAKWRGQNLLGSALMDVRETLKRKVYRSRPVHTNDSRGVRDSRSRAKRGEL